MTVRVSSPTFIGRRRELARVDEAISLAEAGSAAILLIAGEAGIGKSRLVRETIRRATALGMPTSSGACVELGGASLPYAPILEILRNLNPQALGRELDTLPRYVRTELARLVPELARNAAAAERADDAPESAQRRLFDALMSLVRALGRERPLLLVIEDAHWADRSTLQFLGFLGKSLRADRLVLLLTYRSDELHRRHPLLPVLAELQRGDRTERLSLEPFARTDMAQLLTAIRGAESDTETVDRILRRSEGNPFFAEELLAASGGPNRTQELLRDILIARVNALTDATQELLGVASAAGPRFTAGTLAAVAGLPEREVMASLREAVEHSVVIAAGEGASDAFAFRHALVQEAIYGDLLPADRTRIHVAFATTLAGAPAGPERSAELAHHYYAAHDLPAAIESSVRAAEAATAVYAFADGHLLYERALELWPQVPNAETLVGMDRIDLLVRAADAAWASAPPRAVALIREAIASVDPESDPARSGALQQRLCQYAWSAGDGVTALEAGREAVRLVPADPPTVVRAWALARLGQILMVVGFWSEAIEFLRAAIEAARAAGAPGPEGHAFDSLGVAKAYLGDVDGGLADLRHSIEIGIAGGTMEDLGRAYENIVDVLSAVGRFAEAEAEARLGFEYDESHGMTQYFGSTTLAEGGLALIRAGRWREAAELVQEASEYAIAGVSDLLIQQRLALLDVGQGRFDSARRRIERLHEISGRVVEAQMVAPTAEAAAELACWEGRFADASGVIAEALDRIIRIDSGLIGRVGPLYALGLRAEAEISIANRRRHVTAAARELSARAQRILDDVTALHAEAGADRPAFAHLTGAFVDLARAEIARVDGAQADQWAAVARTFEQIPMRSWRAYALWREGEALLAARQPRAARDALERAHGIAVELEALPLRQALEAVGARARIDLTSDHGAESRPSPDDQAGLTKREREVLALVAEGRTNREIASLLFISGKTAGVHVSNILGKLGVSGRTEAAAVARRRGLID